MDISTGITYFLTHCRYEKNLSEKTIKAYFIDLSQFEYFLKESELTTKLESVDKSIIKKYLQILSIHKPKTIKRKVAAIKTMFNFFEYDDVIIVNPFRKIKINIKESILLPNVMNLKEVENILRISYSERNKIRNKQTYIYLSSIRSIAIIELLFATGIRVSELCNIRTNDIDLESGLLIVKGKGNKERIIQICHKASLEPLRSYYGLFSEKIVSSGYFLINRFNSKLSEQSVRNLIKKYAKLAKIGRSITPHTFRHTFATLLLEEDVDIKYIQQMLGHSSILTTQIYTHVNIDKQKRILIAKHPRKYIDSAITV
jgi:integrase/recombinase XerD